MTRTLILRPATASDLAAVDALLARAYPRLLKADYPPSVLVTAVPIIALARPELVACGTYYVVESGGVVVGAGGWTRTRHPQVGDVRHLVTDDRCTRQGIGRALLTRIIGEAAAAGVRLLDCLSTRTAVPFYQAMGFVVLGPCEIALRPGITFPAIRMQRRL